MDMHKKLVNELLIEVIKLNIKTVASALTGMPVDAENIKALTESALQLYEAI